MTDNGALMVRYWRYVKYLLCGTIFSCTLEVQEVRSVEVFTIKFHPSAYLLCWVKFTAHFACKIAYLFSLPILLNSAGKFRQGLPCTHMQD